MNCGNKSKTTVILKSTDLILTREIYHMKSYSSNAAKLLECIPDSKPWRQNREISLSRFEGNLRNLSNEEIRAVFLGSIELQSRLDCEPLYSGLCYFFTAGKAEYLSDDGWNDHTMWIISNGKKEVDLALSSPDIFYSRLGEKEKFVADHGFEGFFSTIYKLLDAHGIDDSYPFNAPPNHWMKTTGFVLDESQLKIRFPKICQKIEKHQLSNGFSEWRRAEFFENA